MTLTLPQLALIQGRIICLHVPDGLHDDGQALIEALVEFVQSDGKSVGVGGLATPRQGVLELFGRQTSQQWLADAAGISLEDAQKLISGFGVPVDEDLSANAATPRCLLGIAATIVSKPDVLIYRTDGLDPRGRIAVHQYAAAKTRELCLVHLSSPTVFGDGSAAPRHCPPNADCIAAVSDCADNLLRPNGPALR
ncbi:MAG: hypothetical protein ACKVP0_16360 [Pirellulaceae bacterium]